MRTALVISIFLLATTTAAWADQPIGARSPFSSSGEVGNLEPIGRERAVDSSPSTSCFQFRVGRMKQTSQSRDEKMEQTYGVLEFPEDYFDYFDYGDHWLDLGMDGRTQIVAVPVAEQVTVGLGLAGGLGVAIPDGDFGLIDYCQLNLAVGLRAGLVIAAGQGMEVEPYLRLALAGNYHFNDWSDDGGFYLFPEWILGVDVTPPSVPFVIGVGMRWQSYTTTSQGFDRAFDRKVDQETIFLSVGLRMNH